MISTNPIQQQQKQQNSSQQNEKPKSSLKSDQSPSRQNAKPSNPVTSDAINPRKRRRKHKNEKRDGASRESNSGPSTKSSAGAGEAGVVSASAPASRESDEEEFGAGTSSSGSGSGSDSEEGVSEDCVSECSSGGSCVELETVSVVSSGGDKDQGAEKISSLPLPLLPHVVRVEKKKKKKKIIKKTPNFKFAFLFGRTLLCGTLSFIGLFFLGSQAPLRVSSPREAISTDASPRATTNLQPSSQEPAARRSSFSAIAAKAPPSPTKPVAPPSVQKRPVVLESPLLKDDANFPSLGAAVKSKQVKQSPRSVPLSS